MTTETTSKITSAIRALLTAFGAYLLGRNLFGTDITESFWQELSGVVMSIVGVVWSIKARELGIEQLQATIRQFITFAGGLLIAYGTITGKDLVLISSIVPTVLPLVYSYISSFKSKLIAKGEINTTQLKKQ